MTVVVDAGGVMGGSVFLSVRLGETTKPSMKQMIGGQTTTIRVGCGDPKLADATDRRW